MKNKKIFACILSLMVIILLNVSVMAQTDNLSRIERLSGEDRFKTSVAISQNGWKSAENVIIAYGRDFPDALCATPLAKKLNAPILLSEKSRLTAEVENELKRLRPQNVYLIGGTAVITTEVEAQIKGALPNAQVKRIAGADRIETSIEVAKLLNYNGKLVIAYGWNYADALSIAPIAAKYEMPIILSRTNELKNTVQQYLHGKNINKAYIIGGPAVISDNIKNSLQNAERISGSNRFETNYEVLNKFKNEINFESIYVAIGIGDGKFADALSASSLVAKNNGVLVLKSSTTDYQNSILQKTKTLLKENSNVKSKIIALGGEAVVPHASVEGILDEQLMLSNSSQYSKNSNVNVVILGDEIKYYDSTVNSNVYIYGNKAHLQNVTVNGEVVVDPGSNGEATLENVKATKVTILSGAQNSIHLVNSEVQNVEVKSEQNVRLVVEGTTKVQKVEVKSDAKIEVKSEEVQITKIEVATENKNTVEFKGQINSEVEVKTSSKIIAAEDTKIENLKVSTSQNEVVEISGQVGNVVVETETKIELNEAVVDKVVANESVEIKGDENSQIKSTEGQGEIKTEGNVVVGQTKPAETLTVTPKEVKIKVGETAKLTINYTPQDTTDTLSIISTNTDVAEVSADGTITGKKAGEAEIVVKIGQKEERVKVVVEEEVVVTGNVIKFNINGLDLKDVTKVEIHYMKDEEVIISELDSNYQLIVEDEQVNLLGSIIYAKDENNNIHMYAYSLDRQVKFENNIVELTLEYNLVNTIAPQLVTNQNGNNLEYSILFANEAEHKYIAHFTNDLKDKVEIIKDGNVLYTLYSEKGEYVDYIKIPQELEKGEYLIKVTRNFGPLYGIKTIESVVNIGTEIVDENATKIKLNLNGLDLINVEEISVNYEIRNKLDGSIVVPMQNDILNENNELVLSLAEGEYLINLHQIFIKTTDNNYYTIFADLNKDIIGSQEENIDIDLMKVNIQINNPKEFDIQGVMLECSDDFIGSILGSSTVNNQVYTLKGEYNNISLVFFGENYKRKYFILTDESISPENNSVVADFTSLSKLQLNLQNAPEDIKYFDILLNNNYIVVFDTSEVYVTKGKYEITNMFLKYSNNNYAITGNKELDLNQDTELNVDLQRAEKCELEIFGDLLPGENIYYYMQVKTVDGMDILNHRGSDDKIEILKDGQVIYQTQADKYDNHFKMPETLEPGIYTLRITRDMGPLYGFVSEEKQFEVYNVNKIKFNFTGIDANTIVDAVVEYQVNEETEIKPLNSNFELLLNEGIGNVFIKNIHFYINGDNRQYQYVVELDKQVETSDKYTQFDVNVNIVGEPELQLPEYINLDEESNCWYMIQYKNEEGNIIYESSPDREDKIQLIKDGEVVFETTGNNQFELPWLDENGTYTVRITSNLGPLFGEVTLEKNVEMGYGRLVDTTVKVNINNFPKEEIEEVKVYWEMLNGTLELDDIYTTNIYSILDENFEMNIKDYLYSYLQELYFYKIEIKTKDNRVYETVLDKFYDFPDKGYFEIDVNLNPVNIILNDSRFGEIKNVEIAQKLDYIYQLASAQNDNKVYIADDVYYVYYVYLNDEYGQNILIKEDFKIDNRFDKIELDTDNLSLLKLNITGIEEEVDNISADIISGWTIGLQYINLGKSGEIYATQNDYYLNTVRIEKGEDVYNKYQYEAINLFEDKTIDVDFGVIAEVYFNDNIIPKKDYWIDLSTHDIYGNYIQHWGSINYPIVVKILDEAGNVIYQTETDYSSIDISKKLSPGQYTLQVEKYFGSVYGTITTTKPITVDDYVTIKLNLEGIDENKLTKLSVNYEVENVDGVEYRSRDLINDQDKEICVEKNANKVVITGYGYAIGDENSDRQWHYYKSINQEIYIDNNQNEMTVYENLGSEIVDAKITIDGELIPGETVAFDIYGITNDGGKVFRLGAIKFEMYDEFNKLILEKLFTLVDGYFLEIPNTLQQGLYKIRLTQDFGPLYGEVVAEEEVMVEFKKVKINIDGIDLSNVERIDVYGTINDLHYQGWSTQNFEFAVSKDAEKLEIYYMNIFVNESVDSEDYIEYHYSIYLNKELELQNEIEEVTLNLAADTVELNIYEYSSNFLPNGNIYYGITLRNIDGNEIGYVMYHGFEMDKIQLIKDGTIIKEFEVSGFDSYFTLPEDIEPGLYTIRVIRDFGPLYGEVVVEKEVEFNFKKIKVTLEGIDENLLNMATDKNLYYSYSNAEYLYWWDIVNFNSDNELIINIANSDNINLEYVYLSFYDGESSYMYYFNIYNYIELNNNLTEVVINLSKKEEASIDISDTLYSGDYIFYDIDFMTLDDVNISYNKYVSSDELGLDKIEIIKDGEVVYETFSDGYIYDSWSTANFTLPSELEEGTYTIRVTRYLGPLYGFATVEKQVQILNN